ncbi:DNA polymerase III subunit delta [Nitratidesulfovibrio vulgaris]|nr:DNA polymerase III subunit delta [Nitratidesulfovibrio vulgaris]ADP86263.1 DNA polymerase III delta [Nitratidesulfovibrio vulgaris RCH1]
MDRPGFSFCICPDSRLLKDHISGLVNATETGGTCFERQVFWGDEALPPVFWEHLTLQGLFGSPRALVVRNAHNLPADVWKRLSTALARPNPLSWPFFCLEVPFERGQPKIPAHIAKLRCLDFAERKGWVWRSPGLDERGIRRFLQQRATDAGARFAPGALDAIAAAMPADATAAATELDKLLLAAGLDATLGPELAKLVSHEPDLDIFAFIKALQGGNAQAVWRQVQRDKLGGDSMVFPFIGMLLRETRQLWQLLSGEPVRLPPSVLPVKQQLAQQLGYSGLTRMLDLTLEAERGIKTGERSPEQSLDALVAGLFTVFARPVPRHTRRM